MGHGVDVTHLKGMIHLRVHFFESGAVAKGVVTKCHHSERQGDGFESSLLVESTLAHSHGVVAQGDTGTLGHGAAIA